MGPSIEQHGAAADALRAVCPDLPAEFTVVHGAYAPSLLRYAKSISGDADLAGDAVQETFYRYLVYRTAGHHVDNDRAWLFHVIRNVLCDQAKASNKRRCVPLEKASAAIDPRQDLDYDLSLTKLSEQLPHLLSARELDCFRLRTQGLRYDEIAIALNLQSGTVGALLTRAMVKLRRVVQR